MRLFSGRSAFPPPIPKPQLLSVGVFSCLIAPVPACCRELLRKPADFANLSNWPFRTTFHSLLAIPRSDLSSVARYLALICAIFGTDQTFYLCQMFCKTPLKLNLYRLNEQLVHLLVCRHAERLNVAWRAIWQ